MKPIFRAMAVLTIFKMDSYYPLDADSVKNALWLNNELLTPRQISNTLNQLQDAQMLYSAQSELTGQVYWVLTEKAASLLGVV